MGKHSALDGATVHPLVADALERRLQSAGPVRGSLPRASSVGWPAEPGRGEGLGWPGGPAEPEGTAGSGSANHPGDDGSLLAVLDQAARDDAAQQPVPVAGAGTPARRTGWRRFFGGGHSGTAA